MMAGSAHVGLRHLLCHLLLLPGVMSGQTMTGHWHGTETCIDGVDPSLKAYATLILDSKGRGSYSTGFHGRVDPVIWDPEQGMLTANVTELNSPSGSPRGKMILQMSRDGEALYGSWISENSKRLFHVHFGRSVAPARFPLSQIFFAGQYGYHCHRVPAAIKTSNGHILVFVESRRTSCNDQAPKDVNMRRSTDGGLTWSPAIRVIGNAADQNGTHTYRNPYPTVLVGGAGGGDRIILNVANSTNEKEWVSLQMVSDDGGDTWSEPVPLPNFEGAMAGVLGGPGNGIELRYWNDTKTADQAPMCANLKRRAGRLLSCGATGYHSGHPMYAAVWFSDDCGDTWTIANTSRTLDAMQECQVAELTNGSVIINMRNTHKSRAVSISHDGGVTWASPWLVPTLPEPTCSAGLINAQDNNTPPPSNQDNNTPPTSNQGNNTPPPKNDLFFSNPASRTQRVNMTVKRSRPNLHPNPNPNSGDAPPEGTWSPGALVWGGPAAYSVLVELNRSHVGVVFEHGVSQPYEMISLGFVPKDKC